MQSSHGEAPTGSGAPLRLGLWVAGGVAVGVAALAGLAVAGMGPNATAAFPFAAYLDAPVGDPMAGECVGPNEHEQVDRLHGGLAHSYCDTTFHGGRSRLFVTTEGDTVWAVSLLTEHPMSDPPDWIDDLASDLDQECGRSGTLLAQGMARLRPVDGDVDPFDHMTQAEGRVWDCGDVVMHISGNDDSTWVISYDDLAPLQRHPELCGTTPLSASSALALLALAALRRRPSPDHEATPCP